MKSKNAIQLAVRFYKSQQTLVGLNRLLVLTGISGILETLPILLSLPLIRGLYLAQDEIVLGSFHLTLISYGIGLGFLLVIRFLVGAKTQQLNAQARLHLMTKFRLNQSDEARKLQKVAFGKSVQAINFLLVGWGQALPGILFTLCGVLLAPIFGALTLSVVFLWLCIIALVKSKQDFWHNQASVLMDRMDSLKTPEIKELHEFRVKAANFDAINKNLREIVILTSLLVALAIQQRLEAITSFNSIVTVVVFLRGLQQLYTAYIMSQQLTALKKFLEKQ